MKSNAAYMNMLKIMLITSVTLSVSACGDPPGKRAFMEGCESVNGGLSRKECKCVYNKLEEKYGEKELEQLNRFPDKYSKKQIDAVLEDSIKAAVLCLK